MPALTYEEDQIEYSPHDLCLAVWIVLNCDGTVKRTGADPNLVTEPPITVSQCGLTAVTLNRLVAAAIEDIDPSGQANVNAAYRRVKPKVTGWTGLADVSSRVSPLVLSLLDAAAPIVDTRNSDVVFGHEEVVSVDEACPSCSRAQGSCAHTVALMTLHNAWCGDERHPQYPFVAVFHKSLDTEPVAGTIRRGRGFSVAQYAWQLKKNPLFIDPWAIDPRLAGNDAKWAELPIHVDVIDPEVDTPEAGWLRAVLDGCACGSCVSPLS